MTWKSDRTPTPRVPALIATSTWNKQFSPIWHQQIPHVPPPRDLQKLGLAQNITHSALQKKAMNPVGLPHHKLAKRKHKKKHWFSPGPVGHQRKPLVFHQVRSVHQASAALAPLAAAEARHSRAASAARRAVDRLFRSWEGPEVRILNQPKGVLASWVGDTHAGISCICTYGQAKVGLVVQPSSSVALVRNDSLRLKDFRGESMKQG